MVSGAAGHVLDGIARAAVIGADKRSNSERESVIFSEEYCEREIAAILMRWHQITRDLERPAPLWDYRLFVHFDLWNSFCTYKGNETLLAAVGPKTMLGCSVVVNPHVEGWHIMSLKEVEEEFIAAHLS